MSKIELRFNSEASITSNENGEMVVEGYVNETEKPSNLLGKKTKFVEVISKGAWTRAIERAKEIHFYAEHDKEKILASTRNDSLELREDERGLYMKATISPTSWGKDYYQLISDGILKSMSFGFRSLKDSWKNLGTHYQRVVDDLELFEVSVVRDPAYSASSIEARGIDVAEIEVPEDVVENVVSLDIRATSDELDALADKLFERLTKKLNEEPEKKQEVEVELEQKVEKEPEDSQKDEQFESGEQEPENKEPDKEQEPNEPEDAPEEPEDEPEKIEEEDKKDSEAIREFINKIKNKNQEEI